MNFGFEHISQEKAKEMMDTEKDYRIIDVRETYEFAKKHIPEAQNIPYGDINAGTLRVLPDMDQLLFVYCKTGQRSVGACKKLAVLGYTNIKEIGGLNTWPYDMVSVD